MNIPLTVAAFDFNYYVTGNGDVVTLNFRFGFPVAYFNIDSYMN